MTIAINPQHLHRPTTRVVVVGLLVAAAVSYAIVQIGSNDTGSVASRTAGTESSAATSSTQELQSELDALYAQAAAGQIGDNDARIDAVRAQLSVAGASTTALGAAPTVAGSQVASVEVLRLQSELDALYAQAAAGQIGDNDARIDAVRAQLSGAVNAEPVRARTFIDGWMVARAAEPVRARTFIDGWMVARAAEPAGARTFIDGWMVARGIEPAVSVG